MHEAAIVELALAFTAVCGTIGAAVALFLRSDLLSRARRARRTPIAELRPGTRAKVVGTLRRAGPVLRSPLTARPCVAWRAEYHLSWESHATDAVIVDETGEITARLADAHVIVSYDYQGFRNQQGAPSAMSSNIPVREGVIVEGDKVAVYGRVAEYEEAAPTGDDREVDYRTAPRRRVVEITGGNQVVLTNRGRLF